MALRIAAVALLASVLIGACSAAPAPSAPTSQPDDQGNVDGRFPELTVERNTDGSLHVAVTDPQARAWRIVVRGIADRADDALELVAEVGDVALAVTVREIDGAAVVDELDLTGLGGDGTAASGGCHRALPVCFGSNGIVLPAEGAATFGVDLALLDPRTPLAISGATSTWPGEPFVLGPWRETRPFVTSEA
ncbi:MAG TPA: hypothetical protein VFK54_07275 [Candidatus Limnocylindrales bacterium]|nr:hypothetical protein [Candidatus Limnocylindrales bacterium]